MTHGIYRVIGFAIVGAYTLRVEFDDGTEQMIDFRPVLQALGDSKYAGGLHVELSRHSHEAPEAARRAFIFLSSIIEGLKQP